MNSIAWHDVKIAADRQRQHFDMSGLEDLATSIDTHGILHPPVLRVDTATNETVLVAGERRWRAMGMLIEMGKLIRHGSAHFAHGHIPYLYLGALSGREAFEAELEENIQREDLTWQERARAESRLHELRGVQNAEIGKKPQTITATATEILQRTNPEAPTAIGGALTAIANRIHLAAHLTDPDVAGAKTEKDAIKVVRQKQQALHNAVLVREYEQNTASQSPHQLFVGDMEVHLRALATASIDVLLTDPPYGIDADTFGDQSGTGHQYADSEAYFEQLMATLSEESYRVCKPKAHAYIFCDPRRFASLQTHFEVAGWEVWPIPIIWAKGNGMLPRPDHAPRRTYECVLFASKGRRIVRAVKADVIAVPATRNLLHGAQKPVEVYVDLLSRSAAPGDTILDPFAGSGTIFPAANRCKLRAIGIELNTDYANIAKLRMAATETEPPTTTTDIPDLEILL